MHGKSLGLAMGVAVFLCGCLLGAGEPGVTPYSAGIVSVRRNAVVTVGGEMRVDYSYRSSKSSIAVPGNRAKFGDLSTRQTNLRIMADVHPSVKAHFKLNLDANSGSNRDRDEILEEALMVMHVAAGPGFEVFAGKGKAPYGQDITLGMVQSYAHAANRADSVEGRVHIIEPPEDNFRDPDSPGGSISLPPMRPGQFARTFMAGMAYEWNQTWRIELAAFQPNKYEYRPRLRGYDKYDARGGAGVGAAGRIWWSPIEPLVLEASAMYARSSAMGRAENRLDIPFHARATGNAYAASLGFDWRSGPWRVFGEYQKGWNWNFTRDYDTDSWQIGMARDIGGGWRLGGMVEGLRISDPNGTGTDDRYAKFVLNVRYEFSAGLFMLAEYGREWFGRDAYGRLAEKRKGDFLGVRVGLSF